MKMKMKMKMMLLVEWFGPVQNHVCVFFLSTPVPRVRLDPHTVKSNTCILRNFYSNFCPQLIYNIYEFIVYIVFDEYHSSLVF